VHRGRVDAQLARLAGPCAGPGVEARDERRAVPVGERLNSNQGLTQVRVLRAGRDGIGEWKDERVNARDDYRAFFNESQTPHAAGIAVLTDSDDTQSTAAGDYANFRACRG